MYHKLVENSNLQNIEKDLQRLFHVKTLHQQPLHHDHAVLEPKQDCDTGSHNWIMNCDHQYRDTSPCFVLVDSVLTPRPASASLQNSHLVHCIHGKGLLSSFGICPHQLEP